jgi:chorismate synthase
VLFLPNTDRTGQTRSPEGVPETIVRPRPGHADLAGALKWGLKQADGVAELASARLTAAGTAAGGVCRLLLAHLGVDILPHVVRIGEAAAKQRAFVGRADLKPLIEKVRTSRVLCLDARAERKMLEEIEAAGAEGDTVGGELEIVAGPLKAGLGAPQPLDARLDSRLGRVLLGIPGIRAVAIGDGLRAGRARGRRFHDPVGFEQGRGYVRPSNRAGGIEGGMTNGEPLVVKGVLKPLASLADPMESASLRDGSPGPAGRVRSDVCAVPAAAVVAAAAVAAVLADAILEETGGSTLKQVTRRFHEER